MKTMVQTYQTIKGRTKAPNGSVQGNTLVNGVGKMVMCFALNDGKVRIYARGSLVRNAGWYKSTKMPGFYYLDVNENEVTYFNWNYFKN